MYEDAEICLECQNGKYLKSSKECKDVDQEAKEFCIRYDPKKNIVFCLECN